MTREIRSLTGIRGVAATWVVLYHVHETDDLHGVVISGGQGKMAGKMWRWGTMGVVSEADIVAALAAFEIVIRQMGYPFKDGAAVNAALGVFARTGKKELQSEAASLRA